MITFGRVIGRFEKPRVPEVGISIERPSHFNVTAAFPNYDRPCQYQHFPTSESYEASLNNG